MIAFIYGTTAELIKIAPVLRLLDERGVRYLLWCTAHHSMEAISSTSQEFGIRPPDRWFVTDPKLTPLSSNSQVPQWACSVLSYSHHNRQALLNDLKQDAHRAYVAVHGDTFTTLLGAKIARRLGARVIHIEAGMRSGSLFSPFPEEIDRILTAKLTDIHFAPSPREVHNLRKARGIVVNTEANTIIDALRLAVDSASVAEELPSRYCLLTLHRFELLRSTSDFTAVVHCMKEHSKKIPVIWVMGGPETVKVKALGLDSLFDSDFQRWEKRSYFNFVPLVSHADHIVTDSGGLQQEATILGIPLAVHRKKTETRHLDGYQTFNLTHMSISALKDFFLNVDSFRHESTLNKYHPSSTIVNTLESLEII